MTGGVQAITVTRGRGVNILTLVGIRPSLKDLLIKIVHKVIEKITPRKNRCAIIIPSRTTIIQRSLFEHVQFVV